MENVVIVESPAKAKTINKYLGDKYKVIASFGHIRDLPAKDGSVKPSEGFSMDWEVEERGEKRLKEIISNLKGSKNLFLATDPDREGEAIAWHVIQELEKRGKLKGINVKRVAFNEITKKAINDAIKNPREIDIELVNAYLARRALDYLVGFTLSPVLWHKLPGSRSAGRVQSVALRLICDREREIEKFRSEEYWTIKGIFKTLRGEEFSAILTTLDGKKLDKFTLKDETIAKAAEDKIKEQSFFVGDIEKKTTKRSPTPPFTTSTLQQEAARKLYMPTKKTMQIAQQLYEGVDIGGETVGLITYMRTDSIQIAKEAQESCRSFIKSIYGDKYLPNQPRFYKNTVKNAQEAHEAIRPTDLYRTPEDVSGYLNKEQLKLYELIWKRTIASQMEDASIDKIGVNIFADNKEIIFRATGQSISFDGFLKVYIEDTDDKEEEDSGFLLPKMEEKEAVKNKSICSEQHFTQPPPRYSEASLVKKLEELGIGRPSTYASIISVLQDRNYVRLDNRRFIPEDRGRIVTIFLENFFSRYVQYDFTAKMEDNLDDVSAGKIEWKDLLNDFWQDFSKNIKDVDPLTITEVLHKLEEALQDHIFPTSESKICPVCGTGNLSLKVGKFGAFIGCSNYPSCHYTRQLDTLSSTKDKEDEEEAGITNKVLGKNPANDKEISLRKGPYGYYIQEGEMSNKGNNKKEKKSLRDEEENKSSGKRVSVPNNFSPDEIDLGVALSLLNLPRILGTDSATGLSVQVGIGRFGGYVKRGDKYKSLTSSDNILEIDLARALELLNTSENSSKKTLGVHPVDGENITTGIGRFGPYVKHGKNYVSIPKSLREGGKEITLEEAIELLKEKEKKGLKGSKSISKKKTQKEKKVSK